MSGRALIKVNKEALKEKENMDCLIEAFYDIMSSTERDFENMKNKSWYKHFWEIITFSQDNKKRLARGVGSLAQMQDIIIKVISSLSYEFSQITNFIKNNRVVINDILERLSSLQNELLHIQDDLITIKKALSHAIFYNRIKLKEIPDGDKQLILCAVYK
jgi:hypothetical protein